VLSVVNNQGETLLHLLVSNKYYIANHLDLLFTCPLKSFIFDILEVKDVNGVLFFFFLLGFVFFFFSFGLFLVSEPDFFALCLSMHSPSRPYSLAAGLCGRQLRRDAPAADVLRQPDCRGLRGRVVPASRGGER
jgi:hypothetical protein